MGTSRGTITFEAGALEKARADGFMMGSFSPRRARRVSGDSGLYPLNAWGAECQRAGRRVVVVCALTSERHIAILFEPGDKESDAADLDRLREVFRRLVGEHPSVDTEDDVEVWVSAHVPLDTALALARELARETRGPRAKAVLHGSSQNPLFVGRRMC